MTVSIAVLIEFFFSSFGNGSSDAGAKQLYAMMDRVRTARTGRKSQGREIRPQKYMAA